MVLALSCSFRRSLTLCCSPLRHREVEGGTRQAGWPLSKPERPFFIFYYFFYFNLIFCIMTHVEIYLCSALEASKAGLLSEEEKKYLKQIWDRPRKMRKSLPNFLYWRLYDMHQKWINHIG